MKKTIRMSTGHVAVVESASKVPVDLENSDNYDTFYTVYIEGTSRVLFYPGKGYPTAKREIVAWYPATKRMWHSFGTTIESAIESAAKDGWLYA